MVQIPLFFAAVPSVCSTPLIFPVVDKSLPEISLAGPPPPIYQNGSQNTQLKNLAGPGVNMLLVLALIVRHQAKLQ